MIEVIDKTRTYDPAICYDCCPPDGPAQDAVALWYGDPVCGECLDGLVTSLYVRHGQLKAAHDTLRAKYDDIRKLSGRLAAELHDTEAELEKVKGEMAA